MAQFVNKINENDVDYSLYDKRINENLAGNAGQALLVTDGDNIDAHEVVYSFNGRTREVLPLKNDYDWDMVKVNDTQSIKDYIESLDLDDNKVEHQFITETKQVNGQISVQKQQPIIADISNLQTELDTKQLDINLTKQYKGIVKYVNDSTHISGHDLKNIAEAIPGEDYVPVPTNELVKDESGLAVVKYNNEYYWQEIGLAATGKAHNSVFRGKNLTSIYTIEQLATKVDNDDFTDLFIGDYINVTINGVVTTLVMAGFDYFYNSGGVESSEEDGALLKHHIVFIPKTYFPTKYKMNEEYVTDGGYVGSEIRTTGLQTYLTYIKNAIGSEHILVHNRKLSDSVFKYGQSRCGAGLTGYTTSAKWTECQLELMSEGMLTGNSLCSSSYWDDNDTSMQLPLFRLAPEYKLADRQTYFLSSIASGNEFCAMIGNGSCSHVGADSEYYLRPYFVFGKGDN